MATLKMKNECLNTATYASTSLFLAAALLYFFPVGIPHKLAFPLIIITVSSLWLCPWQITLALGCSALGDWLGDEGHFIGQMAAFAAAHIGYILFFVKRYHTKVEPDRKLTAKAKGYTFIFLFMGAVLTFWSCCIIAPEAPAGIVRIGVIIYTFIICTMMVTALLQRSSLFAIGAVLFVFSDLILAWNMFVEPIDGAGYLIMIPYYIGQWMLFIRSTPYRIPGLRRHRM